MEKNLFVIAFVCFLATRIAPVVSQKQVATSKTTTRSLRQSACGQGTYQYQVKSGDTCYTIGTAAKIFKNFKTYGIFQFQN